MFRSDDSLDVNLTRMEEADHARYPVVRGDMNNIVGVLNARQWLAQTVRYKGEQSSAISRCKRRSMCRKPSPAWSCWTPSATLICTWRL